jgi:hypothetical protein
MGAPYIDLRQATQEGRVTSGSRQSKKRVGREHSWHRDSPQKQAFIGNQLIYKGISNLAQEVLYKYYNNNKNAEPQ